MQPYQEAAVQKLREALTTLSEFDEVPADDAYVTLDDDNTLYQLDADEGLVTLGHLRDILSIFEEA